MVATVAVAATVAVVVALEKIIHLSCCRKASLFLPWTSSELCSIHGPTSGRRDSARAFGMRMGVTSHYGVLNFACC